MISIFEDGPSSLSEPGNSCFKTNEYYYSTFIFGTNKKFEYCRMSEPIFSRQSLAV